jgi:hypothetical protein
MNSSASEQNLVAALRRLAQDTEVPAPDPESERALLAVFDAAWEQPRRVSARPRSYRTAAAAVAALAATIAWTIAHRPPEVPTGTRAALASFAGRVDLPAPLAAPALLSKPPAVVPPAVRPHRLPHRTLPAASRTTEFVVWPGASGLPTFESGHLMRVDMPTPIVLSLGLEPPASPTAVVQADVLVGQDGLPRAVRLVP